MSKTKRIDLLLISVDSPVKLGVYEDKKLIKSFCKDGKFSDSLPQIFGEILAEYFENKTRDSGDLGDFLRGDSSDFLRNEFNIYYANGPGNFSAIKLTHIFLQTLQIALNALDSSKNLSIAEQNNANCDSTNHDSVNHNATNQNSANQNTTNHNATRENPRIRLFCTDAFHFSDSEFINAYGKIHFMKVNGEIRTTTLESKRANSFTLPKTLNESIFSDKCAPLYILPAV